MQRAAQDGSGRWIGDGDTEARQRNTLNVSCLVG